MLPTDAAMPPNMRRDMLDIHQMRFTGASFTAFEARWALIHIDELILDAEEGKTPSVLMNRVTDHFWKRFAYDVNCHFEMFGFVLWKTRREKIYAKDDPIRKRKYGTGFSDYVWVDVPFVVPFLAVDLETKMDENFREIVVPLDENGRPRKDIFVAYSRRGGIRIKTQRFETECGALLEDWRRFEKLKSLHDDVARQGALVVPYVEHLPINEQNRMREAERGVEALLHGPKNLDPTGFETAAEAVLRKVDGNTQLNKQPFVMVPFDRRLCTVQPQPRLEFDYEKLRLSWVGHLAATLQIPLRHMQTEEKTGLGSGGNEATVQDDMARAVRGAGERRNEIVDVLSDAFEKIFSVRPSHVHLPTASHMNPALLFSMQERGFMSDDSIKDELSVVLGMKRQRFS